MLVSAGLLAGVLCAAGPAGPPVPVAYNGYLILRFRVPAWGLVPAQRAVLVTQRFTALVSEGLVAQARGKPVPTLVLSEHPGFWCVRVRDGGVLLTVTEADGAANHTTAAQLAALWAQRCRVALALSLTGRRPATGLAGPLPLASELAAVAVSPPAQLALLASPRTGRPGF
jgi:hypothetical protein